MVINTSSKTTALILKIQIIYFLNIMTQFYQLKARPVKSPNLFIISKEVRSFEMLNAFFSSVS